jgi:hypothetical protein
MVAVTSNAIIDLAWENEHEHERYAEADQIASDAR